MGSACCVAARERTIQPDSGGEVLLSNNRHSPTWSFRWDNRRRVAGEESSITWWSDGISRNDGSEIKYDSSLTSERGSPADRAWQRSPVFEPIPSEKSNSRNTSVDGSLELVKESIESPAAPHQSPIKLSNSLASTSSLASSPLLTQNLIQPSPNWPRPSLGKKSSPKEERPMTTTPQGSQSNCGSTHNVSDLKAYSYRENPSFENESFGFHGEKMSRQASRNSSPPCTDLQTCGACSRLLSERSLWSSQKIISTNDLCVVAVLVCGHVYHADCLEHMTPEIEKYDPTCPICTIGEKKTHKLSDKAIKSEMDLKVKSIKKLRNRVVDSDLDSCSLKSDSKKSSSKHEGKGAKMGASSSMKIATTEKPILSRPFSFSFKGARSSPDNHPIKKKGFFWAKSSKT